MKRIRLLPVLVLSMLLSGALAPAQVIGRLVADVPFAFHAGQAKFPPGRYVLRMEEGSDLTTMEISSADGTHSALFEVRDAQAPRPPKHGELIFNHVGGRYFLAKVFDDGVKNGSALVDTGYSKKYGAGLTSGEQKHVPIIHSNS
jgi:hypothetical protein